MEDLKHKIGESKSFAERKAGFDGHIKHLIEREPIDWSVDEFPRFWPRILALDKCLQEARPWNFWVLFRDRRDTLQYWTFL